MLFPIAFNPVIELANRLQTTAFQMKLLIPSSEGISPVGAAIYLEWDVQEHDDPMGWYYAIVSQHYADGQSQVMYSNSDTKTLNLKPAHWVLMRKGAKVFLPNSKAPPRYLLKKVRDKTTKVISSTQNLTQLRHMLMTSQFFWVTFRTVRWL